MKLWKLLSFAAAFLLPNLAHAAPICPVLTGASSAYYAADTAASQNCNTILTIGATGTISVAYVNTHPYDGNDDNYVGVINNYGSAVNSIHLSSNTDIFGFDGDGIDAYGVTGNSMDTTTYGPGAYGGQFAYFTSINSTATAGNVNFIGGIASGGSGYFSLEEAPQAGSITGSVSNVTPEPSTFVMLGTSLLGLAGAARRRLR